VFDLCGTPTEAVWPGCSQLPYYNMVKKDANEALPNRLLQRFRDRSNDRAPKMNDKAVDLLSKLLTLDPKKRIDASTSLDHDWFWSDPMPSNPSDMPRYASSHEYMTKKRRQEQKAPVPEAKRPAHNDSRPAPNSGDRPRNNGVRNGGHH